MPSIFSFKSAAPTQCSSRYSRSVRRAKSKQDACKSDITQATRVSEVSADSEQCEGDQVNASEIGNGVRQEVSGVLEVAVNGQAEDDRLVSEDLTVDEEWSRQAGGWQSSDEDDSLVSEDVDEEMMDGVHCEIESETSTLEQSREEFVISMEIELEKNEVVICKLRTKCWLKKMKVLERKIAH